MEEGRDNEEGMGKPCEEVKLEEIEEMEDSEMEVDLAKVSDDTPVSLLNLAILARKVQRTTMSPGCSDCSAFSRVIPS